jgi:phage tail-like protein
MAKLQATSGALPAFKFRVEFPEFSMGFNSVSGVSQETEEILYRTGDEETRQHKLRGLTTFGDVTLQQGLLRDDTLIQEALDTFNIENGQAANAKEYVFGEIRIVQQDQSGDDILEWVLENAWISSYELDDYDSNTSSLQFLSVNLKHEGIRFRKLS